MINIPCFVVKYYTNKFDECFFPKQIRFKCFCFFLAIRDQECLLPFIATMLIECENSTQLETLIEVLSFGVNMAQFDGGLVYALVKTDVSLSNVWNNVNTLLR